MMWNNYFHQFKDIKTEVQGVNNLPRIIQWLLGQIQALFTSEPALLTNVLEGLELEPYDFLPSI